MTSYEEINQFPIIGELNDQDLLSIRTYLRINEFASGTAILRQGQEADHFHIILSGVLDVYVQGETKVHVAKLRPGQFVGEMSCLTGGAVSATVQANGPIRTVSMPREGLLQLMDKSAEFRNHMVDAMVQRISNSNDRIVEEYMRSSVLLRQLQEEQQSRYGELVGESLFMNGLRSEIAEWSRREDTLCIIGENGVGRAHAALEIHALSRRAECPVFLLDGVNLQLEEWETKIRSARGGTIILRDADALPADLLRRLAHSLDDTRFILTARHPLELAKDRIEIVPLRERTEDIPSLVYSFIADAGFDSPERLMSQEAMNLIGNFPFLAGNVEELRRVVHEALIRSNGDTIRIPHLRFGSAREPGTRPRIALALGSGGSRGAAHIGVIKVLEQAGIPIDMIAGTSVGAFIGALYAGGQPVAAFERVLPTVRWRQLVRPTLPQNGFVDNHPMVRFVENYIGPVDFHELRIPFAAVASNALNGEAHILNKGKVSHAICASTAIPGVIRPVRHEGHLMLDGAVAHPVPVALARSMGADMVIAVDLSTPDSAKREPANFVATILNTIDIMSKRMMQDELQLADIVLNPRLENGSISFKLSSLHIQEGERVARDSLSAIQDKLQSISS
ncbi:patatin-like phospholipase family protein [Cohnella fermenti]|uniref:Cyclic nucleotide-binding domain-containing protein n=1 Tax=Cohnella fermenti TaxID=2565925 RepID=A0A4S4BIH4_9BACL|nr:patatin-like phospholipase family protein [Cohnella fermenti]THF74290.1 cyclic nucleotide-binding domain-containing protein [Cohnella fermenti]